jgi:hypothetical protein
MKPIEQYKDYDDYCQDARAAGLANTKEERQVLFHSFTDEEDVRDLLGRMKKFLSAPGRGAVTKSKMYRALNLERAPKKIYQEAFSRLYKSGLIETGRDPGHTKRGRVAMIIEWAEQPKPVVISDERYYELISRAGFTGNEKIVDVAPSEAQASPVAEEESVLSDADPLDQLIDGRKMSGADK